MAALAQTITIGLASTTFTPPTHGERFLVRMENLDDTNDCWVNIGGGAAAAEADDCVIISPGQSYYARYRASYAGIAITAAVKLLLEASNGRS